MKSVSNGLVNYVSFVRTYDMQVEAYNVKLEKIVGTSEYNFTGLTDISVSQACYDFITLAIDLVNTDVDGGEYYLTISGAGGDYAKYLCNVKDHEYVNSSNVNTLLSSTVKISNL